MPCDVYTEAIILLGYTKQDVLCDVYTDELLLSCDEDRVDIPFDILGRPVDRVGMPDILWTRDRNVCCAVVSCCVAFAKLVCFYNRCVAAEPFLVYSSAVILSNKLIKINLRREGVPNQSHPSHYSP